ncbi:cytochrome c3 family protein [Sutterella sp.]|uniref:cytochrome c3 family protein n=1 Tax=Sutterella sp. TaxID=1981025 RepID=UPI0026E0467A|nr:cytochrome c3 family protein [Sutterella sp.]MDO5532444.1 cytochrome c3 family protein [Sutterella sp.]
MIRKAPLIAIAAMTALMALYPVPEAAAADPQQCLMCHGGNFDALREQTKNWKDEFGDQIQPHQYLDPNAANPHAGEKVVPDCEGCHQAHPFPIPKDYKREPASFSMCYGCHHMENFQKCSDAGCHEK